MYAVPYYVYCYTYKQSQKPLKVTEHSNNLDNSGDADVLIVPLCNMSRYKIFSQVFLHPGCSLMTLEGNKTYLKCIICLPLSGRFRQYFIVLLSLGVCSFHQGTFIIYVRCIQMRCWLNKLSAKTCYINEMKRDHVRNTIWLWQYKSVQGPSYPVTFSQAMIFNSVNITH
jgi:hypothetical protein